MVITQKKEPAGANNGDSFMAAVVLPSMLRRNVPTPGASFTFLTYGASI